MGVLCGRQIGEKTKDVNNHQTNGGRYGIPHDTGE